MKGREIEPPGAVYLGAGRARFSVWAPGFESVNLVLLAPGERTIALERRSCGTHVIETNAAPGDRYFFELDGRRLPDPASRLQPEGVHGPSALVDLAFDWTDEAFRPPALERSVFYELHVGAFTEAGTFDAAIAELDALAELGVTTVELLPVSQFPGARNWGYDGVYPYAVQDSYGGPGGLMRFVDACHARGLGVALDVVYNHLGPEGNYLREYGPYFTERYRTPWGAALNFDGPDSDPVRRYFIESALYFVSHFHVDALRVDAIHAILDTSATPFLQELAGDVHRRAEQLGRPVYVIAESDLNDSRVIRPPEAGGIGMDAQWSDDFHHALHAELTGERAGYYADFGSVGALATAYERGYVYSGQHSSYRRRRHGNSAADRPGRQFVVFSQNHDQVGNRARGDRLSAMLGFSELKLVACALMLSPFVPLLFMGEEYGETAPFQYFTSHGDPALAEAVRDGRRGEFRAFGWDPSAIPDPQDPATFQRSKLTRARSMSDDGRVLRDLYRELIELRCEQPALGTAMLETVLARADEAARSLSVERRALRDRVKFGFAFEEAFTMDLGFSDGPWVKLLDTEAERWGGAGTRAADRFGPDGGSVTLAAKSCVLYASSW